MEIRLMAKPLAYRSFLLTAWEERHPAAATDPVWRFGLEDVRSTKRRRVFATLEEVLRYVQAELADRSTTGEAEHTDPFASTSSPDG
jgi:hypothetical protein